jgi:hypothetical protein
MTPNTNPVTTGAPVRPVADDAIIPCARCKTHGQSIVRVEGFCEACFVVERIDPIKKELRNSEEVVSRLNDALYVQLNRLGIARKVQLGVVPRNAYKCHKCGEYQADSMLHLIWHEENCKGTKKPKQRRDAGQKRIKVERNGVSEDEDFI